jgi:uroporphyrinogen decarboxylase
MTATMTLRERTLAALHHRQPDRCPTFSWWNKPIDDRLRAHLDLADEQSVEVELGCTPWHGVGTGLEIPDSHWETIFQFTPKSYQEGEGKWVNSAGAAVDEGYYVHHPLARAESLEEFEAFSYVCPEWVKPANDATRRKVREIQAGDAIAKGGIAQPFKTAWEIRGMENLLCDFMINPEFVEFLYDRIYATGTRQLVEAARCGVDVLQIHGDLAMQDRLLMPPNIWRKHDKPRLAALIEQVKAANPDVQVFLHSDGDMTAIVDDLVEVGLDILNPIQPECMDPYETKKRWGDRLVLHGGVSLQRTLPCGSPEDVGAEVRALIAGCAAGGGYVLGPTNGLTHDVPLENIVAMYETANATPIP